MTDANGAANIVPAMTVDEGAAKALALIEEYDYVSFAQLGREIPGFSAEGHEATLICIGNDVFWAVTSFGNEVFKRIKSRVAFHPSSLLVYPHLFWIPGKDAPATLPEPDDDAPPWTDVADVDDAPSPPPPPARHGSKAWFMDIRHWTPPPKATRASW